jgi:hypothetical protein
LEHGRLCKLNFVRALGIAHVKSRSVAKKQLLRTQSSGTKFK